MAILSLYISPNEISTEELKGLVEKSYATFRHPDVTPLKKLNGKTFILELFHGPTFAFKDVALQLLGNLFEFFLLRRNARKAAGEQQEKLTVVGATSGDTGRCASINNVLSRFIYFQQCCNLWSTQQGQHLHLHPSPQRPRFADPRSPDDYSDRRERPQCLCQRHVR